MVEKAGLWLDEGYIFGTGGEGFERFNLAIPRSVLEDACQRLLKALENKVFMIKTMEILNKR